MDLYTEMAAFANKRPSVFVGVKPFSELSLGALERSIKFMLNKIQPLCVQPLGIRLDSFQTAAGAQVPADFGMRFVKNANVVTFESVDVLKLRLSFGVVTAQSIGDVLSTITVTMDKISFELGGNGKAVTCRPSASRVIVDKPERAPDFPQLIAANNLDVDDVTRLEGGVVYGGIEHAIGETIGTQGVSLAEMFPGLSFSGRVDLGVSSDGIFLFVSASNVQQSPGSICSCSDPGDGIGPLQQSVGTRPNPADPSSAGSLHLGRRGTVDPNTVIAPRTRHQGIGLSGLFLPTDFVQRWAQGPYLALTDDFGDNGFIGYDGFWLVDFNKVDIKLEPSLGRFSVTLEFRIRVEGDVTINFGKVLGTIRISHFQASQPAGSGANSVIIRTYAVVGTGGIYMKPVLEEVNIADFEINQRIGSLVGTPFGAEGAVAGFIFDQIIDRIVAAEIPVRLDDSLRKAMAPLLFKLIQFPEAMRFNGFTNPRDRPRVLYDGGDQGMLLSPDHMGL